MKDIVPTGPLKEISEIEPSPKTELELISETLLASIDDHKDRIQVYYDEMAEIELKPDFGVEVDVENIERLEGVDDIYGLEEKVGGEVRSLLRASRNLTEANRDTLVMADELNARLKDMRKSMEKRRFIRNAPANAAIDLEEKNTEHFAQGMNLYKVLLVFAIGSFLGVFVELLWCLLKHGYLESRSALVFGPFNPVYGIGAVALSLALYKFRNRGSWLSFLGGFVVGSAVEYFCSWAQEMVFHSTSWDYSHMSFNLNGRICLLYSLFWGLLGVVWIKNLYPRMAAWILKLPNRVGKILTVAVVIFLLLDSVISFAAVWRWEERTRDIPPTDNISVVLDEHFPDERMEKIYANLEFR